LDTSHKINFWGPIPFSREKKRGMVYFHPGEGFFGETRLSLAKKVVNKGEGRGDEVSAAQNFG